MGPREESGYFFQETLDKKHEAGMRVTRFPLSVNVWHIGAMKRTQSPIVPGRKVLASSTNRKICTRAESYLESHLVSLIAPKPRLFDRKIYPVSAIHLIVVIFNRRFFPLPAFTFSSISRGGLFLSSISGGVPNGKIHVGPCTSIVKQSRISRSLLP